MRRRRPARDLRTAIDCMPLSTRVATLEGMESTRIIVGAYTDRSGGVCPMLAAHRNGGRTAFAGFARAWDCYTGARRRPRPATARELNTLRAMLQASIALEEARDGGGAAPPIRPVLAAAVPPPRRVRPRACGARRRCPRAG